MFHITTSLSAIAEAEKVCASTRLTTDEKRLLLNELRMTIAIDLACLPAHATIANAVIGRMIEDEQRYREPLSPAPAKQGRKAKGVKVSTSVDAEGAEEATEAPSGPTTGIEEPSQDA